jgi:hypothetical protein
MNIIIFVLCIAVRCVSTAIVGSGDKPPCATGWVRNRIVIVARVNVRYSTFSEFSGYVFVKVKVMLSVPQSFISSRIFWFSVVALRHLSSFCDVRRTEPSWWMSPAPSFFSVRVRRSVNTCCHFVPVCSHYCYTTFFMSSVLLWISR